MAHRLEGVGEEVVDGRGDDGVEALDAEVEEGGEVEAAAGAKPKQVSGY